MAKIKECCAVGVAGGPDRCRFVVDELGFDAWVDHRSPDFANLLKIVCPKGIDVHFENVEGAVRQTVWPLKRLRPPSPSVGWSRSATRQANCGARSVFRLAQTAAVARFIVSDFVSKQPDFLRDVAEWAGAGGI
jgi:NADPH-dependent curcumin reductase CurA